MTVVGALSQTALVTGLAGVGSFLFLMGPILSLLARLLPATMLRSPVKIRGNLLRANITIENLDLGDWGLRLISPYLYLPYSLSVMKLRHFSLTIPYSVFRGGSVEVHVEGLTCDLLSQGNDYWDPQLEENADRFRQAVEAACAARIAQANLLWSTIRQKMEQIQGAQETTQKFEEEKRKASEGEEPPSLPWWQEKLDVIIDNLSLLVKEISVRVFTAKMATVGLELAEIQLEKGEIKAHTTTRLRNLTVNGLAVYVDTEYTTARHVNPKKEEGDLAVILVDYENRAIDLENEREREKVERHFYALRPMRLDLRVEMPPVFQGLLRPQHFLVGLSPPILKLVKVSLSIKNVPLTLQPDTLRGLFGVWDHMQYFLNWQAHAQAADEVSLMQLRPEEFRAYRECFAILEGEGPLARSLRVRTQKQLSELEKKMEIKEILRGRAMARRFNVPSGGEKVKDAPSEASLEADLMTLVSKTVGWYDHSLKEFEDSNLFVRCVTLDFQLHSLSVSVLKEKTKERAQRERKLLTLSIEGLGVGGAVGLYDMEGETPWVGLTMELERLRLTDDRESSANVFKSLMDKNPECSKMLVLNSRILANGIAECSLELQDFSIIANVEPVMEAAQDLIGALYTLPKEFEPRKPPENLRRHPDPIVYVRDDVQPYSPVLLFSLIPKNVIDLSAVMVGLAITGVEVVAALDYSVKKSHTIGLSSSLFFEIESSQEREKISLQLDEVALEPCSIEAEERGIKFTKPETNRSLLELSGPGPDIDIVLDTHLIKLDEEAEGDKEKESGEGEEKREVEGRKAVVLHQSSSSPSQESQAPFKLSDGSKREESALKTYLDKKEETLSSKEEERFPRVHDVDAGGRMAEKRGSEKKEAEGEEKEEKESLQAPTFLPHPSSSDIDGREPSDILIEPPRAQRCLYAKFKVCSIHFSKDDVALLLAMGKRMASSAMEDTKSTKEARKEREKKEKELKKKEKEASLKRFREIFEDIDKNETGSLTREEIKELLLRVMKKSITLTELEEMVHEFFSVVDEDNSGDISLQEFLHFMDPSETQYKQKHQGHARLVAEEYADNFYTKELAEKYAEIISKQRPEEIGDFSDPSHFYYGRAPVEILDEDLWSRGYNPNNAVVIGPSSRPRTDTRGGANADLDPGNEASEDLREDILLSVDEAAGVVLDSSDIPEEELEAEQQHRQEAERRDEVTQEQLTRFPTVYPGEGTPVEVQAALSQPSEESSQRKSPAALDTSTSDDASLPASCEDKPAASLAAMQKRLFELHSAARARYGPEGSEEVTKLSLRLFYEIYQRECEVTLQSLNGQSPLIIQEKLVRLFRSHDFARKAWKKLILPFLRSRADRSPWLLRGSSPIEGVTEVQKLMEKVLELSATSLTDEEREREKEKRERKRRPMLVRTDVETEFGGLDVSLHDPRLPTGQSALRFSVEGVNLLVGLAIWEGGTPDRTQQKAPGQLFYPQDIVSCSLSFFLRGEYYNASVKAMEPFIEPYGGQLALYKEPNADLNLQLLSRYYFNINCTDALLKHVKATIESFSSKLKPREKERPHINDIGGLFWVHNQTGYRVVCVVESIAQESDARPNPPVELEHLQWKPCIIKDETLEDMQEQQERTRKKQLCALFREEDEDENGSLSVDQVRDLLTGVYKAKGLSEEQLKEEVDRFLELAQQSRDEELEKEKGRADVEENQDLIEEDPRKKEIPFRHFVSAIERSTKQARRTMRMEIDGFEPISNISLDNMDVLIYELIPKLPFSLSGKETEEELYELGKKLYTQQPPTETSLLQAYGLFRLSIAKDGNNYGRVQGYIQRCLASVSPKRIAVHFTSDSTNGLCASLRSNLQIRNAMASVTEVQFYDENEKVVGPAGEDLQTWRSKVGRLREEKEEEDSEERQLTRDRPDEAARKSGTEPFLSVAGCDRIAIPLPLVDKGYYAIRQVGEKEWSNKLKLRTTTEDEDKALKEKIAKEKKKAQESATTSSVKVTDEDGNFTFPLADRIDEQPLTMTRHTVNNQESCFDYQINILPQFIFENTLPVAMEYKIVQDDDEFSDFSQDEPEPESQRGLRPSADLDGSLTATGKSSERASAASADTNPSTASGAGGGDLRASDTLSSMTSGGGGGGDEASEGGRSRRRSRGGDKRGGKGRLDELFDAVTGVNARKGMVDSGQKQQISGLTMSKDAWLRVRLMNNFVSGKSKDEEETRDGQGDEEEKERLHPTRVEEKFTDWSKDIWIPLFSRGEKSFCSTKLSISFPPSIEFQLVPTWYEGHTPQLVASASFWLFNKTNLPMRYKASSLQTSDRENREIFNNNEVPIIMTSHHNKEKLSILPETDPEEGDNNDWLSGFSPRTKTKIADPKPDWSSSVDITNVGYPGTIENKGSYTLAYEVQVAPAQYLRTKIVTLHPRYVLQNNTKQLLKIAPLNIGRKGATVDFMDEREKTRRNVELLEVKAGESAILYQFYGKEDKKKGIRLKDISSSPSDASANAGWSELLPVDEDRDIFLWSQGVQGDGPLFSLSVSMQGPTSYIVIEDVTEKPPFRIDNKSTKHSITYHQAGLEGATSVSLEPLRWASWAWESQGSGGNEDLELEVKVGKQRFRVKLSEIKTLPVFSPDDGMTHVYAEIYVENNTRVLCFRDAPITHYDLARKGEGFLSYVAVDVRLLGVTVNIIDSRPRELLTVYLEDLAIQSPPKSRKVELSLHHMEIDDMTEGSQYPLVFVPKDSGFRSDRQENWTPEKGEKPFLTLKLDTDPSTDIFLLKQLNVGLGNMLCQVNADYLLTVANIFMRIVPQKSPQQAALEGQSTCREFAMRKAVKADPQVSRRQLYINALFLKAFDFDLVFLSDPENNESALQQFLPATIANMIGGIAHITPSFHFRDIAYRSRFFSPDGLGMDLAWKFIYQLLGQWYKVVGSVELLGDPMGFVHDVASGFKRFVRQTGREITGKSDKKGEGAKILLQTIIGAPSVAIGKATNGLGDAVKRVTYFENQEGPEEPKHLGQGFKQGGEVFAKSIRYGARKLVEQPLQGMKQEGAKGAIKGTAKGLVTFAASPFVGILGAGEKVAKSVDSTIHLMDDTRHEGPRRPSRALVGEQQALKPLSETNVITKLEVVLWKAVALSPSSTAPHARIRLFLREPAPHQLEEEKWRTVETFKTRKIRSKSPEWNEAVTFDIRSAKAEVMIKVYDERPLQPKVLLGQITKPLQEIFEEFRECSISALADKEDHRAAALAVSKIHATKKDKKKKADFASQIERRNLVETVVQQRREREDKLRTSSKSTENDSEDEDEEENNPPEEEEKTGEESDQEKKAAASGPEEERQNESETNEERNRKWEQGESGAMLESNQEQDAPAGEGETRPPLAQTVEEAPLSRDVQEGLEVAMTKEVVEGVLRRRKARKFHLQNERGEELESKIFVAFRYLSDLRR